jgi:hypothetical protein|tara:strand:+ start:950 stop:1204 length:255 start_codon:yes stop_codon:yes gene_type:complete
MKKSYLAEVIKEELTNYILEQERNIMKAISSRMSAEKSFEKSKELSKRSEVLRQAIKDALDKNDFMKASELIEKMKQLSEEIES